MSRLARAVLIFTFSVTAAWAAFVAAMLWLPAIGSPSGDAIRYSLMRRAGGSMLMRDFYNCEQRPHDVRMCEVPDAQNSSAARYRLEMDGRCWKARKVSLDRGEEQFPPMKHRINGCVGFRDQVRLFERTVGG